MTSVQVGIDQSQAKVSLISTPDVPGVAARIFEILHEWGIAVNLVVQNSPQPGHDGRANMSFLVPQSQLPNVHRCLSALSLELHLGAATVNPAIGVLTLSGLEPQLTAGARSAATYARAFGALRDAGINLHLITAQGTKLTIVTTSEDVQRAALLLVDAFTPQADAL